MVLTQTNTSFTLYIRATTTSRFWNYYQIWPSTTRSDTTPLSAAHMIVVVTPATTSFGFTFRYAVYINGEKFSFPNFAFEMERPFWNSSNRLSFFSTRPVEGNADIGSSRPWHGAIHSFAIYSRNLTAAEVQQNYQARVPNCRPLALNITRPVQRDGEVGTHYDTPEFYLESVPVLELPTLPLLAVDADEDPGSPNYYLAAPPFSILLTSLPSKGTLYFLNGTEITAAPAPVPRSRPLPGDKYTTSTAYVRYRPLWREVSAPDVYTSFTFVGVDGVTGLAGDPATVGIVVTPTHDLPIAWPNLTAAAMARVPVAIPLNGTTSGGAVVAAAFVARLPQHGSLYQINASDGSVAFAQGPIALPAAGSVGAKLWGLAVAYVYTGPQNLTLADDGTMATDTFSFRVGDDVSAISLRADVSVAVRPSIEAVAVKGTPSTVEDTSAELVVYAADAIYNYHQQQQQQQPQRALCFEITALPRHGSLLHPDTLAPMDAPGTVIQGQLAAAGEPFAANATIHYRSALDFFNWPVVAWDRGALESVPQGDEDDGEESFDFRAMLCDDPGAVSLPATQGLRVVNHNDPTSVAAPALDFTVLALGSLSAGAGDDGISTITTNSTSSNTSSNNTSSSSSSTDGGDLDRQQQPDLLVITGWSVDDPDRGVDPVVVRLEAQHGIVRLNPEHVGLADFTSARFCNAPGVKWTCRGNGEDRAMVFVASPPNLHLLLEGLEYQCARTNVVDTITLMVFDGEQPEEEEKEDTASTEMGTSSPTARQTEGSAGSDLLCLPRAAFNNTSDRSSGCLVTTVTFTVKVGQSAIFDVLPPSSLSLSCQAVPTSLWMAVGALGVYVVLVTATCFWRARRRRFRVGAEEAVAATAPSVDQGKMDK